MKLNNYLIYCVVLLGGFSAKAAEISLAVCDSSDKKATDYVQVRILKDKNTGAIRMATDFPNIKKDLDNYVRHFGPRVSHENLIYAAGPYSFLEIGLSAQDTNGDKHISKHLLDGTSYQVTCKVSEQELKKAMAIYNGIGGNAVAAAEIVKTFLSRHQIGLNEDKNLLVVELNSTIERQMKALDFRSGSQVSSINFTGIADKPIFTKDGKRYIFQAYNGERKDAPAYPRILTVDTKNGQLVNEIDFKDILAPVPISQSEDSSLLVATVAKSVNAKESRSAVLINTTTGQIEQIIDLGVGGSLSENYLSPDNQYMAIVNKSGNIQIFKIQDGSSTIGASVKGPLYFSADSKSIFASQGNFLKAMDLSGQIVNSLDLGAEFSILKQSKNHEYLMIRLQNKIGLVNLKSMSKVMLSPSNNELGLAFSNDNSLIAFITQNSTNSTLKIFNTVNGQLRWEKTLATNDTSLMISPNSRVIAIGSGPNGDHKVSVVRSEDGSEIYSLQQDLRADIVGFSADGKILVTADDLPNYGDSWTSFNRILDLSKLVP